MSDKSVIASIPTTIDLSQHYLVDYWAQEVGVSRARLLQAVRKVGPEVADIQRLVLNGITIAIQDDKGVVRRVTKIMPMTDGFAVSVPYHSAREGWLFKHRVDYQGTFGTSKFEEDSHFTAGDRVKLSMHLDGGFVQFSKGGSQPIISGRDKDTGKIRGLGLAAPHPIVVTSGPLFGVQINNLEEFELLGDREAEVFVPEDFYIHPRMTHADSKAYHLEGFMLPREWGAQATNVGDKLVLIRELPFISMFRFPFHVRIIEFPRLKWVVGLLIHRMDDFGNGYRLNGPSYGPPGEQMAIGAYYPRPGFLSKITKVSSLDYQPPPEESTKNV